MLLTLHPYYLKTPVKSLPCIQSKAVGLKSDGTTGQTTGNLEVDTPRATVPSLSKYDGHTMGHWPVAFFKRRDRRWDTFNCPSSGKWFVTGPLGFWVFLCRKTM